MPTSTHTVHCVLSSETHSVMKELGRRISAVVKRGGMTFEDQVQLAVLFEHILQEFCQPEVTDYVQETTPISPTPESEKE